MEKILEKIHLTYYNLLIAQDLRQAHYQKFVELNISAATVFLNT